MQAGANSQLLPRSTAAADAFVAAYVLWLQNVLLQSELSASTRELELSRRRLLDAAVSERQRIQRDLHDGAQQHLVGMRVKLGLAQASVGKDPARVERLLAGLQAELDAALQEVRLLANGVYPPLLSQHGLTGALKAACRRSSKPISLQMRGLGRYAREIEGAVYFTCLEALQNAEKHAGRDTRTVLAVWRECEQLRFEVRDWGVGFDPVQAGGGTGLLSMRDRIEAVSGTLRIGSTPGGGTVVTGTVPVSNHNSRPRRASVTLSTQQPVRSLIR